MFAVRKFRGRTYICEHMLCANLESFSMAEGRFVYHLLTAPNKVGVLLHSVLNTKQYSDNHCDRTSKHSSFFVFLSFACFSSLSLLLAAPPPHWPPLTLPPSPSCPPASLPAPLDPLSSRASCSSQRSTLICRLSPP